MEIGQFKVILHLDIEEETSGEIGKGHEVANRLHHVPTQIVERSKEDQRELRKSRHTAHREDRLRLSGRRFPDRGNLVMHLTHFTFQHIQLSL